MEVVVLEFVCLLPDSAKSYHRLLANGKNPTNINENEKRYVEKITNSTKKKIRRRVKKINKRLHRNCVHSELNR